MDLSIIKASLVLHFLFCQQVDSAIHSLPKYQMSSNNDSDNLLESFIKNFNTVYLEKRVPRDITIVGAFSEELQQVQSLLGSYPSTICTDLEICRYERWLSPGSFVIIFLDDLREETVIKTAKILSQCRKCKVLYIFNGIIENDCDIRSFFILPVQKCGVNARLAHLDNNLARFYGPLFMKNCSIGVRLVTVWTPGAELKGTDSWVTGLRDMNGCPITLSTLNFAPKMVVKENEDGSVMIAGGIEGRLILALAEKFNFTLEPRYPSMPERLKYSRKSAIILDVNNGNTDIGIGRLRPYTSEVYEKIAYSIAYDHDCITWGVPRVMNWVNNIVWLEFTWQVWTFIGLIFTIICIIGSVCHNIDSSINGKQKNIGFTLIVLDIVAIHLGIPITNLPASLSGRFMLIMSLYYAIVVTTAYKTSLASILTTDNGSPAITNADGILRENLTVGGGAYNLDFLKDQADEDDMISELIKRFVVINDPSEVMRRLKFDKNFVCLSRRSALSHERQMIATAEKRIPFNILKECVLYHETVIVFRKESPLRERADVMIRRLMESGILNYWGSFVPDHDEMIKQRSSATNYFASNTGDKFKNVYLLYFVCIVFCFIAFLVEIGMAMYIRFKEHTTCVQLGQGQG